jgi:hypothetical protein
MFAFYFDAKGKLSSWGPWHQRQEGIFENGGATFSISTD